MKTKTLKKFMEKIQKIKFLIKRSPTIVLVGENTKILKKFIQHLIFKKLLPTNIMIFETPEEKIEPVKFYLKKTDFGVIILKDEIKDFERLLNFLKDLPPKTYFVFNFEEKKLKKLKDSVNLHSLSFGLSKEADVFLSNLKFNSGMNLKISFGGSTIPFWLEKIFGKEYILSLLATICFGILYGINLIEISKAFRDFEGVPGKKRLIEGISGSFILDDSKSFDEKEQKESLEILNEIQWPKRKICVLDDCSREEILKKALKICDLAFVFGKKESFQTMEKKLYFFESIKKGTNELKKILKENDLVLILGSRKKEFEDLVDEIRKIW
jgi:UDP-N-acetylmuramyl pentapeptide synthase